ncbi:hypothetical protein SmJEL517_g01302 [Synchytrium microbalum]|uniref:Pentacotripeptide-repeat region of PRORP domain-containing protein n=1 Tax=Synchytrium microbalum TaxID=1806994 RepID=A0A507CBV2_9FUNG|nr:uncharacterized protein SmJEL517_g01302 [Synchytrium microbalum]TPX36639.1 hypothetical protein SmJEL517_g01302 [Synchytrium microbalum]
MTPKNASALLACSTRYSNSTISVIPTKPQCSRRSAQTRARRILFDNIPRISAIPPPAPSPDANPVFLLRNALALSQPLKAIEYWSQINTSESRMQNLRMLSSDDYAGLLRAITHPEIQKRSEIRRSVMDVIENTGQAGVEENVIVNVERTSELQAEIVRSQGLKDLGEIVKRAVGFGKPLSTPVCKVVFESLAANQRWMAASQLLAQIYKEGDTITPKIAEYMVLTLSAYRKTTTESESLTQLLQAMYTLPPSLSVNKALMDFFADYGRITPVNKYFDDLKKAGIQPDSGCYDALIKTHVVRGQLGDAIHTYAEMRKRGLEATDATYINLINGHSDAKDVAGAVRFFYKKHSVPGYTPSASVCAALVSAYASAGELQKAWRTVKTSMDVQKTRFTTGDFTALAAAHANKHTDMLRDALTWAEISKNKHRKISLTHNLIQSMVDLHSQEGAHGVLRLAADLEKALKMHLTDNIKSCMVSAHAMLGETDKAEQMLEAFKFKPTNRQPYNLLLKAYADAKDPAGIHRVRAVMKQSNVQPDSDTFEALLTGASDNDAVKLIVNQMYQSGWIPGEEHVKSLATIDSKKLLLFA